MNKEVLDIYIAEVFTEVESEGLDGFVSEPPDTDVGSIEPAESASLFTGVETYVPQVMLKAENVVLKLNR